MLGQIIHHLAVGKSRVQAEVQHVGQTRTLADHFLHEPHGAFGRVGRAAPQHGVQETVAQPVAVQATVIVALHREAGQERMVHRLAVVAVISAAWLLAMHLDRKAVDVDRAAADGPVWAGPHVADYPLRQGPRSA